MDVNLGALILAVEAEAVYLHEVSAPAESDEMRAERKALVEKVYGLHKVTNQNGTRIPEDENLTLAIAQCWLNLHREVVIAAEVYRHLEKKHAQV